MVLISKTMERCFCGVSIPKLAFDQNRQKQEDHHEYIDC